MYLLFGMVVYRLVRHVRSGRLSFCVRVSAGTGEDGRRRVPETYC